MREITTRPVQLRGSRLARWALRAWGWQLLFDGLPAPQGVVVVYPHTSNWDFVVGLLAKWATGIPVRFWSKDTLFRVPLFGRWLRSLGGIPVSRHTAQGAVAEAVRALADARRDGRIAWLALAPEGTRSRTAGWRSGFHRVAMQAGVPLGAAVLDWGSRRVGVVGFWWPSGDDAADCAVLDARLGGCRGRRPDQASPVRPMRRDAAACDDPKECR